MAEIKKLGKPRTPSESACKYCKGSGYLGRIGIHEVLSGPDLFDPSSSFLSIRDAGMRHINEGLIDRAMLANEVCI